MVSLERAFSLAEANLRFEGMQSSSEAQKIFDRVKNGGLSFEEARGELLERIKKRGTQARPELTTEAPFNF